MATKIIKDNYSFFEGLCTDSYEEKKFAENDSPAYAASPTGIGISNVIVLLASITTIIDFVLKYLNKNKTGKIRLKKGDSELTIDGNYNKEELKEILKSYTIIASDDDIGKYLKIKKNFIVQEILSLESSIDNYKKFSEEIPEKHKDRVKKYIFRINYWNERKNFLKTC